MIPRKSARLKQPAKCGAAERVLIVSHVAGASLPHASTGSDTRPIRANGTTATSSPRCANRRALLCGCVWVRAAGSGTGESDARCAISVKISYVLAKLSLSYPKVVCGSDAAGKQQVEGLQGERTDCCQSQTSCARGACVSPRCAADAELLPVCFRAKSRQV